MTSNTQGDTPTDNSGKIILDLCGGTGAWSKPYRDAGYDVRVITLPDYDVTDTFVDLSFIVFRHQNGGEDMEIRDISQIYGILAAPPCTQFSLARTTAKTPRDFRGGMEIVQACLNIIWQCQHDGHKLAFWAMENPRALLRRFLGVPNYTFEHWQFGDLGIKPTDIWGYFNHPKKKVIDRPEGLTRKFPNGSSMAANWNPRQLPGLKKADMRAITPAGFARSFMEANK